MNDLIKSYIDNHDELFYYYENGNYSKDCFLVFKKDFFLF